MKPEEVLRELNELVATAELGSLCALAASLTAAAAHAAARCLQAERAKPEPQTGERDRAPSRCLTMPQAAKETGINVNTLREAGRRGELPIVQLGRYIYLREESLGRWIGARESKARR